MHGTRVSGLVVVAIAALCGAGSAQTQNRLARFDNGVAVNSTIVDNGGDGSVERIRVDASGNVGIGTTTPSAKLEISNGDIFVWRGNGIFAHLNGAKTAGIQLGTSAPSHDLSFLTGNPGTTKMYISKAGYVGLGTTTPEQKLTIASGSIKLDNFGYVSSYRGSANSFTNLFLGGAIVDNGNGSYLVHGDGASNYFAAIRMDSAGGNAGAINFYSGAAIGGSNYNLTNAQLADYQRMTILGGNVGIGTSNPVWKLDVEQGSIRVGTSAAQYPWPGVGMFGPDGHQINLYPSLGAGNYNSIVQAGDQALIYSNGSVGSGAFVIAPHVSGVLSGLRMDQNGNVGIGTTAPTQKLQVAGNVKVDGAVQFADGTVQTTAWTGVLCGGDYAESVDVTERKAAYEPGDVLVIDKKNPGHFAKSTEPYSRLVAGIYSTKPGVVGRRSTDAEKAKDEVPMAMVGIVPTKVSAENGPIEPGDLLVTSSTPGYAMKATDFGRAIGAMVGKALTGLEAGTGVIDVLVSLQ